LGVDDRKPLDGQISDLFCLLSSLRKKKERERERERER
jgi:hypothetical protein